MHQRPILVVLCLAMIPCAGCTMMKTMASQTVEALRPSTFDGWDPGSESSDPWVQQAGAEARGSRPVEKEADPLGLKKYLMSNRARDIERNLGIE